MPLNHRLVLCAAALLLSAPPVSATHWQAYADRSHMKREVDADSVSLEDGLAWFVYRETSSGYGDPIVRMMRGVVDCANRKRSDLLNGRYELRDVFDGTDQADQMALVCGLAKQGGGQKRDPALQLSRQKAATPGVEDWRTYDRGVTRSRQLDAGSLRVHDGLVWFNYRELVSYEVPEAFRRGLSGVVDCRGRRSADVEGGRYELRGILEGTQQAAQLDLACELARKSPASDAPAPEPRLAAAPAPAPPPAPAVSYSPEDARILWEEAAYTFDGTAYDYTLYRFASEEEATHCEGDWQCSPRAHRLEERTAERSNEIAPWLRPAVVSPIGDARSKPVHDPVTDAWIVAQVTARRPATFDVRGVQPMAWLAAHAATALPSADALRSDPALRVRSALNRVFTVAGLQAALAAQAFGTADLDRSLSNGSTLLVRALARHDEALADALVAAGASVDACGAKICPLEYVIAAQDHAGLRWLLARGVRVDRASDHAGALPPLALAAMVGDRDGVLLLLDAKADPLVSVDENLGRQVLHRSLAFYVPSEQAEFLDLVYARMEQADERSGRFKWSAWIEQGGVRHPIVDGATITLKALPFRIVMKLPDDTSFRILSSEDPAFIGETRSGVMRRKMLGPGRSGAVGPDSRFIDVGRFVARDGARDFDGSSIELSWSAASDYPTGTKRVADKLGGHLDIHDVEEFITPSGTIANRNFAGHTVHVLVGTVTSHGTASDFFKPARLDIVLR